MRAFGFHTTSWTLIRAAAAKPTAESREALATLCQKYWQPVYAFVRSRGYDREQSQDLTQGFFALLIWVDRSGVPVHTLSQEVSFERPRLSPNQLSVAGDRRGVIWVTDLLRESSERNTFDDIAGNFAVWSKDGSRIAFKRAQGGIYAINVGGRGQPKLLTETQGIPTSWSGQYLLYTFPPAPQGKIYLLDVAGTKKPIQVGSCQRKLRRRSVFARR